MGDQLTERFLRAADVHCPECGARIAALNGVRCPKCRMALELVLDQGGERARPSVLALAASLATLLVFVLPGVAVVARAIDHASPVMDFKTLVLVGVLAFGVGLHVTLVVRWRRRVRQSSRSANWPGWITAFASILLNLVAAASWVALLIWA